MISAPKEISLNGEVGSTVVVASSKSRPRIIRMIDELAGLEQGWDVLASRWGSPIDSFRWAKACAGMIAGDRLSLYMVAVGGSRPTAIAPLVRRSECGDRLELLGVNEHFEPMDFLYESPQALSALTCTLVRLGLPLFLKRVVADSPVVPELRRSCRGRAVIVCRPVSGAPWIPLDAGWANPEQKLGPGRASDIRRARKNAARLGQLRFEVLSPCMPEVNHLVEEAFQVEAASWKGRAGSAMLQDPLRGQFYRQFAAAACERGILRMCFMRIDGRPVAMQMAAECGRRFWLLKIGYDEQFSRCSPGTLLMLETLRYAATHGLSSYEFLGTDEPWTRVWTQNIRPCVSVRIYQITGNGMMALVADLSRIAWCKTAGRVRIRS